MADHEPEAKRSGDGATDAGALPNDRGAQRRHDHPVSATAAMAIVLVVVAALSVIALAGLDNRQSESEHFVTVIRNEHPTLSPSRASDADLLRVARASCSPDGMSEADLRWLRHRGVDVDDFRHEAEALCPQR